MRLRRSAVPFWVLTVALSALTGFTVLRLVNEASARAERLGGLVDVPVAARSIEAGASLRAADVIVRRLPAAILPDAPPARSPTGKVALVPLVAGEVVLAAKLAPEGLRGVAALVPPGWRALAVPADAGGLSLRPGDRVDVLATFEIADGADSTVEAAPTFPVATDAVVVDVADEAVTIAVSSERASRVAFALARATVTLALVGA